MDKKKFFIFDLDGTLVDAYRAIERSLNFARKNFGYSPVPFADVKRNVGNGDRNFIACFFPEQEREQALKIYRKHHRSALKKYVQAKQYARFLLYNLKRKKKLVALATNRPSPYTHIILKTLGLKKYFDRVLCADEKDSLKPAPRMLNKILKHFALDKKEALYCGDMDVDMETARRAGVDACFVRGGSSSLSEVRKFKKMTVNSLKEILSAA